MSEASKLLRNIPSMDRMLSLEWVQSYYATIGRKAVKSLIEGILTSYREDILNGSRKDLDIGALMDDIKDVLDRKSRRSLRRVINATGVIVHTNLGRSCLAEEAIEAVVQASRYYSNLEYDLDEGRRGHRYDHVEWLLCQLTGAEAALVVNNNASAVLLCLAALAADGEAIISRGELIEIGESFRIPDIMAFSGAKMVEVGTTNRTHLYDYERAINENTKIILKVHPSNYRIVGFHSEAERRDLTNLAHSKGLLVMEDLGSGFLVDLSSFGLKGEPTIGQCIADGVDIVTFSGDKLLGGPQVGGIVGKKDIVSSLKKHPLLRAVRIDKMTLAALESTLRLYLRGDFTKIPTICMITTNTKDLQKRADDLSSSLREFLDEKKGWLVETIKVKDVVGGGAFPDDELDGFGVAIRPPKDTNPSMLAARLRKLDIPIIANLEQDRLIFHVRTMLAEDYTVLISEMGRIV